MSKEGPQNPFQPVQLGEGGMGVVVYTASVECFTD